MAFSPNQSLPLVLYVDDDPDDRMLLTDVLGSLTPAYTVETVDSAYQAIDFLHQHLNNLPCLVILDLNMPGMNGKELLRILKNDPVLSLVPVVAFTTSSNPDDRQMCAAYGVEMFTKPLSFSELTRTVQQLLSYCRVSS
jgi:CheY-like chemotaxis protein